MSQGTAAEEKVYVGRAPGVVNLNLTMPRDAARLLAKFAPSKKGHGAFLARLLYEHDARVEERQRLKDALGGGSLLT